MLFVDRRGGQLLAGADLVREFCRSLKGISNHHDLSACRGHRAMQHSLFVSIHHKPSAFAVLRAF
jgi:hypothetical protein